MTTIKLLHKTEGRKFKRPFAWMSVPDKLIEKTYQVPYVSGRSMRTSNVVANLVDKARKNEPFTPDEIDECCDWFCGLFQNQFTRQELLDGYEVDSLLPDIIAAYMAIQAGTMKILKSFPLPQPTAKPKK